MAAPITHVVLAEKIYSKHLEKFERKNFYLGTLFPDIRYLAELDRNITHERGWHLKNVLGSKTSFEAGFKLHSLIDEIREKFMWEQGVYDWYERTGYLTRALKFLEDEILYDKIKTWVEIQGYLSQTAEEEKNYGASETEIITWHNILHLYMSQKPDDSSREHFWTGSLIEAKTQARFNELIIELKHDPAVLRIIEKFYDDF